MKLYKYVPFNDKSVDILSSNTMKFSKANEFNDPFDCVVNYDVERSIKHIKKDRKDLLLDSDLYPGLSAAKRIQMRGQRLHKIKLAMENGTIQSDIVNTWGICSLSKNPLSILMWSHYAENHRGFVAEFDSSLTHSADYPEKTLASWKIDYSSKMPKTHMGVSNFDDLKRMFLVKALEWDYEQEYRCLAHNSGPGIHKFKPEILTKIIAGAKMDPEHYRKLELLVSQYNHQHTLAVELCRVELSKASYELKFV